MRATDSLLADHKMIRKLMAEFRLDNPRFSAIAETAHRIIAGHAWFEDVIFFPALGKSPVLARRFNESLGREHQDIEILISLLRDPKTDRSLLDGYLRQFRTVMDAHFLKEEGALFPLVEHILDAEGLNRIGDEMRARQDESRAAYKGLTASS